MNDVLHDIKYEVSPRNPEAGGCTCGRFRMVRREGENSLHFYSRARQAFDRHLSVESNPPPGPIGANQRTSA